MSTTRTELMGFLNATISTPLQDTVVKMNVCPECHKKTLVHKYTCKYFKAAQCSRCLTICMQSPDE